VGTDLKLGFVWWEASLLNGGVKGGMPEGKRMPEREGNEPGGAEVAVVHAPYIHSHRHNDRSVTLVQ